MAAPGQACLPLKYLACNVGCSLGDAATFYTLVHARTSRETLPVRPLLQAMLRTRQMHDNFTYFKPTLLLSPTASMQPHDICQDIMTETQPSKYGNA